MNLRPNDMKIIDRYLEYMNCHKFSLVLQELAGTPYGRVVIALMAAASGIGAPIAVIQGRKTLAHRSR